MNLDLQLPSLLLILLFVLSAFLALPFLFGPGARADAYSSFSNAPAGKVRKLNRLTFIPIVLIVLPIFIGTSVFCFQQMLRPPISHESLISEAKETYGLTLPKASAEQLIPSLKRQQSDYDAVAEKSNEILRFGTTEVATDDGVIEIQLIWDTDQWILADLGATELKELPRR